MTESEISYQNLSDYVQFLLKERFKVNKKTLHERFISAYGSNNSPDRTYAQSTTLDDFHSIATR